MVSRLSRFMHPALVFKGGSVVIYDYHRLFVCYLK